MTNLIVSKSVSAGLLGLSVLLATSPAQALDLTTWSTAGDVSVAGSGGSLTNFSPLLGGDDAVNYNVSSNVPVGIDALESFLNLPPSTLANSPTEGSAIKQTFTAQAGDSFSFNWQFFTNEPAATGLPDYAFVTVNSGVNVLAGIGDALTPSSPFATQTGINSFSYIFPTAGEYTIGIGVVDGGTDFITSSALQIGNASYRPIPTPALLPGLVGFGVAALRRRLTK